MEIIVTFKNGRKAYKIAVVVSKKPEVIQFDDNKKPTIRKLEDVIII